MPSVAVTYVVDGYVQKRQSALLSARSVPYVPKPSPAFDRAMAQGWETRIDRTRNYYLMRLWGLLSDEECHTVGAHVVSEIRLQMQPGFTLISDISECKPLSKQGTVIVRDSAMAVAKMGALGAMVGTR